MRVTGAKPPLDIAGNLAGRVLTSLSGTMAACPPSLLMSGGAVNTKALQDRRASFAVILQG